MVPHAECKFAEMEYPLEVLFKDPHSGELRTLEVTVRGDHFVTDALEILSAEVALPRASLLPSASLLFSPCRWHPIPRSPRPCRREPMWFTTMT